jgi:hypothetical protein
MEQPAVLALGVILLFMLFLGFALLAARNSNQQKSSRALDLGFEKLEAPPDSLLSRVETLHRRRESQKLMISQVYRQRDLNRQIYLFDLEDTQSDDSSLGSEILGVISRDLALPHFTLISLPEMKNDGFLGQMMDSLLDRFFDWAGKFQKLERVEFPAYPDFDQRFVVFARDKYSVQNLFSGRTGSFLLSSPLSLSLTGSGDFLTAEASSALDQQEQSDRNHLRTLYRFTMDLIQVLENR